MKDPETFLEEIVGSFAAALFLVPNMELLPYLHDWRVPLASLEGDHKNFSRARACAIC